MTETLSSNIVWLGHDCFCIQGSKTVYTDPFHLKKGLLPADLVLVSHDHFDHCSPEDLALVVTEKTVIVAAPKAARKIGKNTKSILPGQSITVLGITITAIPAYNLNKFRVPGEHFHPKSEEFVGFVFELDGKRYYHAGDTDFVPEMKTLKNIDVAFLPISGVYVMTPTEAAEAANSIKAKLSIPMHYGDIVGGTKELEEFKQKTKVPIQVLEKKE